MILSEGYTIKLKLNNENFLKGKLNNLIIIKGFKLNKVYKFKMYTRKDLTPRIRMETKDNIECPILFYNSVNELAEEWDPIYPRFHSMKTAIELAFLRRLKKITEFVVRITGGDKNG